MTLAYALLGEASCQPNATSFALFVPLMAMIPSDRGHGSARIAASVCLDLRSARFPKKTVPVLLTVAKSQAARTAHRLQSKDVRSLITKLES